MRNIRPTLWHVGLGQVKLDPSLGDVWQRLSELWDPSFQGIVNVIDILLVTYLIYRLLKLVRGGRAWRIVLGVAVFVLALIISERLGLKTLHWILDKATLLAPVALVILLLPELRQAVEGFAKIGFLPDRLMTGDTKMGANALEEIVAAVSEMADQRIGALIVLERSTKLDDIAENGVPIRATVTAALLGAIFYHGNPLHDGAAIIRRDQILAAACRLPLSESPTIDSHYHMRHRAGVGISEQCDAIVVIVSEERGAISVARDGKLTILRSIQELREILNKELRGVQSDKTRRSRRNRHLPTEVGGPQ